MRFVRAITATGAASVSLLAACTSVPNHGESPTQPDSRQPQSSVTDGPKPTIEKAGFGGRGDYLWVTSIVRDVQAGKFVTVSFNLLNADGTILATATQTEQGINPNARIIIGTQVHAPDGQTVARVEPTIGLNEYSVSRTPEFSDVVLGVGDVTIGENSFNTPTARR